MILVFVIVALVALAVVWWYAARRVKSDLDDSPTAVAGASGVIELRAGDASRSCAS